MFSASVGLLIGRFLFAYLLIALIVLIFSRFKLELLRKRLHSFRGMAAVWAIFLIPFLAPMGASV